MSDKTSFEMILDAYCERCAFKACVCDVMESKCPAYSMNLMVSQMMANASEHMLSPLKTRANVPDN